MEVLQTSVVDNHRDTKKSRGQLLCEIVDALTAYADAYPDAVYLRERTAYVKNVSAFSALNEVAGVTRATVWRLRQTDFEELPPVTIKLLLTGNRKATKDEVAAALAQFVGERTYQYDDESDATAVGVAWLIQHGLVDKPETDQKNISSVSKTTNEQHSITMDT